jgi:hypothetical protein
MLRVQLRKRIWLALLAVAVVTLGAIMVTASLAANAPTTSPSPTASTSVDTPVPDVRAPSPHYLSRPPYFLNTTEKETRIYLKNATMWYGTPDSAIAKNVGYKVPDGTSVFIINGTIQNDYTTEQIIESSQGRLDTCFIGLDLYVYYSQGNSLPLFERGNPLRGTYEIGLKGGENAYFNMIFDTPSTSKTFAYFEIYVAFIDPIPQS